MPAVPATVVSTSQRSASHGSIAVLGTVSRSSRVPKETLRISGRKGELAYINGVYNLQSLVVFDGCATYRHQELLGFNFGDHAFAPIYLYYHAINGAWALGLTVGSTIVVGFSLCAAAFVEDINGPWIFQVCDFGCVCYEGGRERGVGEGMGYSWCRVILARLRY